MGTQTAVAPGRPVRLELNAQRVTAAMAFYRALFGWTSRPLHVPPWGAILLIANGDRVFGNEFMAMGAFSVPRWMSWFTADLAHAEARIKALGGDVGQGIYPLGDLGDLLDGRDPAGNPFHLIDPRNAPREDAAGDPCLAELWGPGVSALADFYADVLQLQAVKTESGAVLHDGGAPRLFFRDTDFEIQPPRWIPYFKSAGVGGDCERARRAGAVVQVHRHTLEHLGELAVLADPAGAYFGLVTPDSAGALADEAAVDAAGDVVPGGVGV